MIFLFVKKAWNYPNLFLKGRLIRLDIKQYLLNFFYKIFLGKFLSSNFCKNSSLNPRFPVLHFKPFLIFFFFFIPKSFRLLFCSSISFRCFWDLSFRQLKTIPSFICMFLSLSVCVCVRVCVCVCVCV